MLSAGGRQLDGNHVEKKRDDAELSSKLEGDRAYHDFLLTFPRNGLDWTKRSSVVAGALDIPRPCSTRGSHQGRPDKLFRLQQSMDDSHSRRYFRALYEQTYRKPHAQEPRPQ